MYRLMICEDNRHHIQMIRKMLEPFDKLFKEVTCYSCVEELDRAIHKNGPPDILLMDICLPDEDGIKAVKRLFPTGSATQVIYVTGYVKFCTSVYETEHVSFLLKPVEQKEFQIALQRALDRVEGERKKGLFVRDPSGTCLLLFLKISYIESVARKVYFHTQECTYQTYATLNEVEQQVDGRFLRCHKSFLVNLDYVLSHTPTDFILLDQATKVPISARRATASKQHYLQHMKHKTLLGTK